MKLSKLQADPTEFRRTLRIDADGQHVRFGETIDDWQAEDFAALDPAWRGWPFFSTSRPQNEGCSEWTAPWSAFARSSCHSVEPLLGMCSRFTPRGKKGRRPESQSSQYWAAWA